MPATQPSDYAATPRQQKDCKKFPWAPILVALLVPTAYFLIGIGATTNKLDALAQSQTDTNGELDRMQSDMPEDYVPRREIDAKLNTLQVQVGGVQAQVEELKDQGERQTAEIIRRIERMDAPRHTP